jgi:hypothetical protein
MLDAIKAARAYVETFFDDSAERGIQRLQKQLTSMGDTATAAGKRLLAMSAPILGIAALAANHFADTSAQIALMAKQTQLGTETVQELGYIAQQSSLDVGILGESFAKQTKLIAEAKSGSQDAAVKLQKLGLTVADVRDLSADEAFALFSDRIAGIDDPTRKAAAAMAVWEDGGTKLLPILNLGADGIARMRQEARDLGVVMSDEDIAAGDAIGSSLNLISQQSGAIANAIGAALAPSLSEFLAWLSPLLTDAIQWIQANDQLIVQIVTLAGGVAAAGGVLVGMGIAASAVATGLGGVLVVTGVIGTVLGGLLSPIGLVAAGLAGLVAYTVDWSDVWSAVTGELGESIGLAADLITNGEITAAFELVWAQIEATWSKGVNWTMETLAGLVMSTLNILADGVDRIGKIVDALILKMGSLAIDAKVFSGEIPREMADFAKQGLKVAASSESAKNSLSGVSDSLRTTADGFRVVGGSVTDAERRLQTLKDKSLAINEEHDRERAAKEQVAATEQKPKAGAPVPLLSAPGGQAGTFSANASRQLYSLAGQSELVEETKEVRRAVNKVETAISKKQRLKT